MVSFSPCLKGLSQVLVQKYEQTLREAEQHRIYTRIPPEKPYGSLDAKLLAELGVTAEQTRLNAAAPPLMVRF
jgi:hypothetical protein